MSVSIMCRTCSEVLKQSIYADSESAFNEHFESQLHRDARADPQQLTKFVKNCEGAIKDLKKKKLIGDEVRKNLEQMYDQHLVEIWIRRMRW